MFSINDQLCYDTKYNLFYQNFNVLRKFFFTYHY